MAEPDNLVLELLRELRADNRRIETKLDQLTECVDQVETSLTGLTHAVIAGFGALVHRLDDHDTRIARLERDHA